MVYRWRHSCVVSIADTYMRQHRKALQLTDRHSWSSKLTNQVKSDRGGLQAKMEPNLGTAMRCRSSRHV
jgi:hypothetical protein